MTLESFHFILIKDNNKRVLAEHMEKNAKKPLVCTNLRNDCCHPAEFTWIAMNNLLINLFMEDRN